MEFAPNSRAGWQATCGVVAAIILSQASCGGGGGGAGGGSGNPPPPPEVTVTQRSGTASNGAAFAARILNIDVQDLQWDAPHGVLYASVTAQSAVRPGSIIALNPGSATIARAVSVTGASILRISDGAEYLYAGFFEPGTVVRYALPDLRSDATLTLGTSAGNGSPLYAQDVDVHPTQPRTVAIATGDRLTSPHMQGPVVYDDAVARPQKTIGFGTATIEWDAAGTTLSGYSNEGNGKDMYVFDVDSAGVRIRDGWFHGVMGTGTMALAGDQYFTSGGEVLRASDWLRAGVYVTPFDCLFAHPESGATLVFALCGSEQNTTSELVVHAFDLKKFQQVATARITNLQTFTGQLLTSMVRYGSNGLAFMTPGRQLVLLEGDFLSSMTQEQRPAPVVQTITSTGVSDEGAAFTLREVSVDAYDVAYDRARARLYLSAPGHARYGANSIIVLNPQSGAFENLRAIGSEPNSLALSAGDEYLYVGIDGSSAVKRILLDTWQVDAVLDLGRATLAPHFAREIVVAPATPGTVAVARSFPLEFYTTPSNGIVVFDGAAQRPRVAGNGSVDEPNGPRSTTIQWGADADTLYGGNTETSEAQFSRYSAPAEGPLFDAEYGTIHAKRFIYMNERFYLSSGAVLEATTGAVVQPSPLGFGDAGQIAIDVHNNTAYFVKQIRPGSETPRYEIHVVTLDTMILRDVLRLVPGPRQDRGQKPFQLVRWGHDGLALLIGHDQPGVAHLLLVNGPAVQP